MSIRSTFTTLAAVALTAALAPMTVAAPAGASVAPAGAAAPRAVTATVVTTQFGSGTYGVFAESMARLGRGLLVSVTDWNTDMEGNGTANLGRLVAVAPDGATSAFGAPMDLGPYGMQCGVATSGRWAFVAAPTFAASPASTVYRVSALGRPQPWLTLPADAWPNGITIDGDDIYVTDSALGVVWHGSTLAPTTRPLTLADAWYADTRLAPAPPTADDPPIGANGVAVAAGGLLVTNWNTGTLYRVPIRPNGRSGRAVVVAHDPSLIEADGIAVDREGRTWVTTNLDGGRLVVVDRGRVRVVAVPEGSLDYPTQAVLRRGVVYVLDGSFFAGAPMVVALRGLPVR